MNTIDQALQRITEARHRNDRASYAQFWVAIHEAQDIHQAELARAQDIIARANDTYAATERRATDILNSLINGPPRPATVPTSNSVTNLHSVTREAYLREVRRA